MAGNRAEAFFFGGIGVGMAIAGPIILQVAGALLATLCAWLLHQEKTDGR